MSYSEGGMSSRLISLLRLLGPRATRTMDNPNSLAVVAQWRRFFAIMEEQNREEEDILAEIIQEQYDNETLRPIATEQSQFMLRHETMQAHRLQLMLRPPVTRESVTLPPPVAPPEPMRGPPRTLEIPVGEDEARYLPQ